MVPTHVIVLQGTYIAEEQAGWPKLSKDKPWDHEQVGSDCIRTAVIGHAVGCNFIFEEFVDAVKKSS